MKKLSELSIEELLLLRHDIIQKGEYQRIMEEHSKFMQVDEELRKRAEQLGEIDFNS